MEPLCCTCEEMSLACHHRHIAAIYGDGEHLPTQFSLL